MKKLALLLLFLHKIAFAQVDLSRGLKAYYPFNSNASDASGNHNDPVFNNAALTVDRQGNPNSAYHFNGKDNFMRIPNRPSLNFADKISLSVQVRPTGFYYDICHASCILSKGGGNYNVGFYALRFDDALYSNGTGCSGDQLTDSIHHNFRGTGTILTPYQPYINKDQWYSVVYINDGATAKLYVDCELKYSISFPETFTSSEDLYIGKSNDPFFPFWLNADLDEVRIYDRALNIDEIAALCTVKKDTVKLKDTVKIKEPDKVPLEERKNELIRQITVDHDSISVTLYDNGIVDGDSVTLLYNKQIVATHQRLTEKPLTYWIKINRNSSNELIMYAENLGSIPPNTALMVIYDGNKRYELNVSSSKDSNGTVAFKLKE
jgi:hypothetical protein